LVETAYVSVCHAGTVLGSRATIVQMNVLFVVLLSDTKMSSEGSTGGLQISRMLKPMMPVDVCAASGGKRQQQQ